MLAGTVDVVASMSEAGGLHSGPTKTGKRRTIAIPRFLAQMLGEHIGRYPSPDGWVFTAARAARSITTTSATATTTVRLEPRSSPGVRFHDLRHTCAALLIAAGRHIEEVKTYLGHSSIRVTSDRYGHLFPEARAAMADALDVTYRNAPAAHSRPRAEIVHAANADQRPRRTADLHVLRLFESGRRDSNPRPQPWQGCALPAEPRPRRPASIQARTRRRTRRPVASPPLDRGGMMHIGIFGGDTARSHDRRRGRRRPRRRAGRLRELRAPPDLRARRDGRARDRRPRGPAHRARDRRRARRTAAIR